MGIRSIFWKVVSGRVPDNGGWVDSMQVDHFDPYTPGQLTKNFTATVADEISVTRGTTVKAIYRDDQWIYVEVSDGRKGFVPQTYCKLLLNSKHGEKKKVIGSSATLDRRWEKSNLQRFIDSLPVQKEEGEVFKMDEICEVQILQSFDGSAPDDISVKDGESVTVLNISDPEWTYIRNSDNQSGFVPSSHVKIPHEILQQASRVIKEKWYQLKDSEDAKICYFCAKNTVPGLDTITILLSVKTCAPLKTTVMENENLLVVEPFSGRSPLDLTVRPGEWIKCTGRPVDDWLWAVRIADEKQGFIPNKVVILATDL